MPKKSILPNHFQLSLMAMLEITPKVGAKINRPSMAVIAEGITLAR